MLASPVPLSGVFAPENPSGPTNLPSSKGYEGLAIFPFSSGRTPGRPDDDEFITIRLDGSLCSR